MAGTKWPGVTKERPCPTCGKTRRCKIAPDGNAARCFRSSEAPAGSPGAPAHVPLVVTASAVAAAGGVCRLTLLTLSDAAGSLAGRLHTSTIHRWRLRGVRGVRLETILIGGVRYTSREALVRFFDATTAVADGEAAHVPAAKQRAKAIEAAERELAKGGI